MNDPGILTRWTKFLQALGRLLVRLVWTVVGIIVLAAVGRFLYLKTQDTPAQAGADAPREVAIADPIPWHEVDAEIVGALREAHVVAERHAQRQVAFWAAQLQQRIDEDFLQWYFDYWQQQWMGLRAMGYWFMDLGMVEQFLGEQPSMAERITGEIQEEFAKRVLRPQIAQLQMERIADATVQLYVGELSRNLAPIPEKYRICQTDWDRHLHNIALVTSGVEGNREIPVTLKTVATAGVAGGAVAAVKVAGLVRPMTARMGARMTTRAAARGGGRAAGSVASRAGAKVGARAGGKFLGAIVGLGVIAWDVWDHQHTRQVEEPILRRNLSDYLSELQYSLLHEPETGLMSVIRQLESNVIASLPDS